jgi:hypothetical protein
MVSKAAPQSSCELHDTVTPIERNWKSPKSIVTEAYSCAPKSAVEAAAPAALKSAAAAAAAIGAASEP